MGMLLKMRFGVPKTEDIGAGHTVQLQALDALSLPLDVERLQFFVIFTIAHLFHESTDFWIGFPVHQRQGIKPLQPELCSKAKAWSSPSHISPRLAQVFQSCRWTSPNTSSSQHPASP